MPTLTGFAPVSIPGPPPTPLLGHLPNVFRFLADPIRVLRELRPYGDVAAVARNNPALVCAFGPERNREVLSNPTGFQNDEDFIKGPVGSPLHKMSKVIISINGELHRRHRTLMLPAFSRAALDRYAPHIVQVSEDCVSSWPLDEFVDLDVLMRELALAIALRTIFGLEPGNNVRDLGALAVELTEVLASPLTIIAPYAVPGTPYRKAQRVGGRVMKVLLELIARKRAVGPTDDALSRLIHSSDEEGGLSDDELLAETLTLFIAGHETIAKTLSWTCLLLERHPRVLAAVLEELDGVLCGRSVRNEDLAQLPLLERVIKESMRVLPAVPTVFLRVASVPIMLGAYELPRNANVVISPFATHHDPELFPQPRRFNPDRWIGFKPTPYEYLPFGAGPRMCVGAAFAMHALRLTLATLLPRVRFQLAAGVVVSHFTRANIMMPKHGLRVRMERWHRRELPLAPIVGDISEIVDFPN